MLWSAIFLVFLAFQAVKLAPVEPEANGLYSIVDNVTILTGNNFKQIIFNSSNIWMVEFYSSWCGHCQVFAPTFKSFARNVADWQEIYRLAVINCPDQTNLATCRDLNVTSFPTMRVFPPFSKPDEPGIKIDERSVEKLRNASVGLIEKYLDKVQWNLSGILKPSFDFITYEDILKFHTDKESPHHYLAVIIEEDSSSVGKELLLDMSSCRNISVRRFDAKSAELKKLEEYSGIDVKETPTVIIFTKRTKAEEIEVTIRHRSFFSFKLHQLPGVGDSEPLPKQEIIDPDPRSSLVDWKKVDRTKVHMVDIESGLRYALMVEVGSVNELTGERLEAIKNFVGTLALFSEHLPITTPSKNFLIRLTGWLASQKSIFHKAWQKRMEVSEPGSYLPRVSERWVGCASSKPGLRGYPCSLWTLFHALTVAGFNKNDEDFQAVPRAMESYISNFFTCTECRKNFMRELLDNPFEDKVKSHKDSVLWLWELHNTVNKRLHGTITEDPNMPKIQFPPATLCPDCRNSLGDWNKRNLVKFLTELYSDGNVLKDFIDVEEPLNPGLPKKDFLNHRDAMPDTDFDQEYEVDLEMAAKFEESDFDEEHMENPRHGPVLHARLAGELQKDRTKDRSIHIIEQLGDRELRHQISRRQRQWRNGISEEFLTGLDVGMCAFLWGISMLAVVLMFLYMKRRSALKRCSI